MNLFAIRSLLVSIGACVCAVLVSGHNEEMKQSRALLLRNNSRTLHHRQKARNYSRLLKCAAGRKNATDQVAAKRNHSCSDHHNDCDDCKRPDHGPFQIKKYKRRLTDDEIVEKYGPYGKQSVRYLFSDEPGAEEELEKYAPFIEKRMVCPFHFMHSAPPNFDKIVPPVWTTEGHSTSCHSCSLSSTESCDECEHLHKRSVDNDPIVIKTYVNVVCSPTERDQCITMDQVKRQMDVVNRIYKVANIKFDWKMEVSLNEDWANGPTTSENLKERFTRPVIDMMRQLHKGNAADLNIYIRSSKIQDVLGVTVTFPHELNTTEQLDPRDDGIIIDYRTMTTDKPESKFELYKKGHTLAHEIGHWLGLFHTFDGGCTGHDIFYQIPDDTPAESLTASLVEVERTCPKRDTCPNDPGMDPTDNYMNYLADECLTRFTISQIRQMRHAYRLWRSGDHLNVAEIALKTLNEAIKAVRKGRLAMTAAALGISPVK